MDSIAWAASGAQQAGIASIGGQSHAGLWSGTASSWVDLNPVGSVQSNIFAASDSLQAGYADLGGVFRAGVWSGTAASWVDLHALLPAGFSESYARGISTDGINTYVSGWGHNSLTGRDEALLWTRPVPAPGAACVLVLGSVLAARRRR